MNQRYSLTHDGVKKLEEELNYLKNDERERNIQALQEARAQGDLSENADYDAARDQQAQIASRISEIENILKNAQIIGDETNNLGKKVKIEFLDLEDIEDKIQEFKIVGSLEANPLRGLISNESPLGHAIVNHKKNDTVNVKLENGLSYRVKILNITEEKK